LSLNVKFYAFSHGVHRVFLLCRRLSRSCSWLQRGQWRHPKNLTPLPSLASKLWTNNAPSRTIREEVTALRRWNSIVWHQKNICNNRMSCTFVLNYSFINLNWKKYAYVYKSYVCKYACVNGKKSRRRWRDYKCNHSPATVVHYGYLWTGCLLTKTK
jgi:hypothetical protein